MDTALPPHFNLTGQVEIRGYTPDFRGNYSSVYRGLLNGEFVAVKIIQETGEIEAMKRKVLRERFVWGSMNHPNIYPFYGYDDNPAFGPFGALVSPWSANGDASRFLKENGERMMLVERVDLWKGVMEGVLYLHDQTPPIVHGDLKPGNILINGFGVPTICDFGLARIFMEQGSTGLTTTSEHTGTARYLAPELVASDTSVYPTLASDVYALGCLGLDFIYLQQPFSSHPNNLRGQIFRNLRRKLPPATERPTRAWPSIRMWPIIIRCWNSDPHARPSAFVAARMLRCTVLIFPTVIIKRIAHFVDIDSDYDDGFNFYLPTWEERCRRLRHLCLVSRACRECVTPFLYRQIRLVLSSLQPLSALMSEVDNSTTNSPLFSQQPAGYGSCTQFMFLGIMEGAIPQSDLAVGIRNLTARLPGLRFLRIDSRLAISPQSSPLTTLFLGGVDVAILFDYRPTLQALESLQRLSIKSCYDSAFSSRPLRDSLSSVYLPNLLEICFHRGEGFLDIIKPFATISTWTMPRLRYLDIRYTRFCGDSLSSDFFKILPTHGPQLQRLRLKCTVLQAQDISNLLTVCTDLRSLEIDEYSSLFAFSASHAHLEKIKVVHWPAQYETPMDIAVRTLKSFKLKAEKSFPKLIEAEFVVVIRGGHSGRYAAASFRTADAFITIRDESKTYRLLDGGGVPIEVNSRG